jgi:diguanylate cyclase (GGDEF)-like protein
MFGYGEGELIGQSARIIYPDDESYEAFGRAAYPLLSIGETFRTQVRMKKKSGELIWVDSNGALVSAKSGESIWMMLDVTRTREHHDLVEVMAFHDSLTGLPNRALLLERLQHSTLAARRNGRNVAVCFVDLNGFKNVNDTLGHDAGDELLREIAMRLQDCVRANDTVARLGGDEFVLLLSDLNTPEESQMVLDRASEAVAREVILKDGRSAQVSASIGVAFFPSQARDAAELLGLADAAMYEAKKAHAALATGFSGPR